MKNLKLQKQKNYDSTFSPIHYLLYIRYISVCHYNKLLNRCLVPFNAALSRRLLITIAQKATIFFILFRQRRNQHNDTRLWYQITFFDHIIPFN